MKETLLSELKSLYRSGFSEDSEQDCDEFFSHIGEENAVYLRENGQIISAGYFTKKPAKIFGEITHLPFLSALSTLPELRGRGKLRTLLQLIFQRLYQMGESVCALYPFHHEYYLRHGFTNISFCTDRTVSGGADMPELEHSVGELIEIESQFASGFDNYLIYGEKEITDKIRAYSIGSAKTVFFKNGYCIEQNGKILHYAFTDPTTIDSIGQLNGYSYCDFSGYGRPHTQGRIINAEKALQNAVYLPQCAEKTLVFNITDDMIVQNNISVELKIKNGKATLIKTKPVHNKTLTIDELTSLIFLGDGKTIPKQKNYFGDLW